MNNVNIKKFAGRYFDHDATSRYLSDIRKYKVPTPEEENELLCRIQKGDEKAKDELIMRNQRFIFALAKNYATNSEEIGDYVSEGNVGMIEAINKGFDMSRGVRFMSYAVWYIRRSMSAYLVNKSLVYKTNRFKVGNKVDKVKQRYYVENGSIPSPQETIDMLNKYYNIKVTEKDLCSMNIISINDEIGDDYSVEDGDEYNKATASYNDYENEIDTEQTAFDVKKLLCCLDDKPKDKAILELLYGIGYEKPYSISEVAAIFSIKNKDVEYVKSKTLKRIRKMALV